jgi:BON domain
MPVDSDVLDRIRERLRVSTRVADDRVQVAARGDDVVLQGAVASAEEATVAEQLAGESASSVVNELQVDPGLREGLEEPLAGEPASPADDELLVGDTDMLAGPEAHITADLAQALDENEPWEPPDVPQLAPTAVEQRIGVSPADRLALGEQAGDDADELLDEEDRAARERPSAPDLERADLERAAEGVPLPSLDPTAAGAAGEGGGDPTARDPLAGTGGTGEDMVEQVPGTAKGPGAVGEPTTSGGALGGTPAVETGAAGADTDPARGASGGVQKVAGTDPGPSPAPADDPAIREEIPDEG